MKHPDFDLQNYFVIKSLQRFLLQSSTITENYEYILFLSNDIFLISPNNKIFF